MKGQGRVVSSRYHSSLAKRKQLKRGTQASMYIQDISLYFEYLQNTFICVLFLLQSFLIHNMESMNIFHFEMKAEKWWCGSFSDSKVMPGDKAYKLLLGGLWSMKWEERWHIIQWILALYLVNLLGESSLHPLPVPRCTNSCLGKRSYNLPKVATDSNAAAL